MAELDFQFDPQTNDLIDAPNGGFAETPNADTMVMHQILCHHEEWWGDETLGSEIHNLNKFQRRPERDAPDEATRALQELVDRGRIRNLEVRAEVPSQGRVNVLARFQDANTGQLVETFVTPGK